MATFPQARKYVAEVDLTLYQGYTMVRGLPRTIGPITEPGPGMWALVDLSSWAR